MSSRAKRSALLPALLVGLVAPLPSQGEAAVADAVLQSLQLCLRAQDADAAPAALVPLIVGYADALGARPQAPVMRRLSGLLEQGTGWEALALSSEVAQLAVAARDLRGADMYLGLPLLLVLAQLRPDDACLQLQLAEAYGVDSAMRDSGRARSAIGRLRQLVGDGVDAVQALRRARSVLELLGAADDDGSDIGWLLAAVVGIDCMLQADAPLRPLQAADLATLQLLEDARLARDLGDQAKLIATLEQLAQQQPQQPAYPLLLGQTLASVGPKWSLDKAQKQLQVFVDDTAPAALARGVDGAGPPFHPAEVRAIVTFLGVPWPDQGLLELRIDARALLDRLGRDKTARLLLHPDRKELEKRADAVQRTLDKDTADRDRCVSSVDDGRREYAEAKRRYEAARSRGGRGARFQTSLGALYSSVQTAKQNLDRREKALQRAQQDVDEGQTLLLQYQQRLRQFRGELGR